MAETDSTHLVSRLLEGDRRALARLMSVAERDADGLGDAALQLKERLGRAHVIGVTGPPGGGKSTLLLRLAQECRARDRSVGVVAVDPTSPVTGGSVLGDRIRLQELHADPRVFIRSMASGGIAGGLASATMDMADLLDAFGFDPVFIETVGVGQGETAIARVADTNVVVVVPGLGDDIQALKAGVLETGDIYVVNKSDRPEAKATLVTLRAMLELGETGLWKPPVLATSALAGDGVPELVDALDAHRAHLHESGDWGRRRARRAIERVRTLAARQLLSALEAETADQCDASSVDAVIQGVVRRLRV